MSRDVEGLRGYSLTFKLQKLRVLEGLNQKEFAKKLGASQTSVSGWELGSCQPSAMTLEKIRQFYGLPFDFFIENEIKSLKGRRKSREKPCS